MATNKKPSKSKPAAKKFTSRKVLETSRAIMRILPFTEEEKLKLKLPSWVSVDKFASCTGSITNIWDVLLRYNISMSILPRAFDGKYLKEIEKAEKIMMGKIHDSCTDEFRAYSVKPHELKYIARALEICDALVDEANVGMILDTYLVEHGKLTDRIQTIEESYGLESHRMKLKRLGIETTK